MPPASVLPALLLAQGVTLGLGAALVLALAIVMKGLCPMLDSLKAAIARLVDLTSALQAKADALKQERDAALARVAELEAQLADLPALEQQAGEVVASLEALAAS